MNLQIYVGECLQTVWVQNFELKEPFAWLAFSANEPERNALLVTRADAGISVPVFINAEVYCGPDLVRQFCQQNAVDIESLHLQPGENFSVQRKQLRLRLVTEDPQRVVVSLDPIARIFHRYTNGGSQ